jgi:DNA-binding PadR family transcriptional regulator
MVLGLIAEEPGTVADIQRRLIDMFPSADFAKNAAHTNLPTLADKGYVRLVRKGAEDSQNFYKVTEDGIDYLRKWVHGIPPPPAMRDPLHAKVEFATLEDLARLVREVRAIETAYRVAHDDAHQRLLSQQRLRMRLGAEDWRADLDRVLSEYHLEDEMGIWGDYADRRTALGDKLEGALRRFARKAD